MAHFPTRRRVKSTGFETSAADPSARVHERHSMLVKGFPDPGLACNASPSAVGEMQENPGFYQDDTPNAQASLILP